MKYFVVFAMCVAAASAFGIRPPVSAAEAAEVQQIIDAIYHPSTDPATAAALEQLLLEVLGINKPVVVEDSPINIDPVIIDEGIVAEPGEDFPPIQVGPAIIDDSIVSQPANYYSPLVQVIVNVNPNAAGNPVAVEQPAPVESPEAEDVIVVDQPEFPENVVVAPVIIPEDVIVAPIGPIPVIPIPDTLN